MRRSTDDGDESILLAMPFEGVRKLLAEAAELPNEERAELVDELAGTLQETYAQDEHDLDYYELDRRMEAVRRGTAVVIPWDEARREILSDK
jgi:putative addiction module component (TIGR02574 family)